jgi:hypothetical protein
MLIFVATAVAFFLVLTYAAWRRYLWAAEKSHHAQRGMLPPALGRADARD